MRGQSQIRKIALEVERSFSFHAAKELLNVWTGVWQIGPKIGLSRDRAAYFKVRGPIDCSSVKGEREGTASLSLSD